jgi:hypothetical protein
MATPTISIDLITSIAIALQSARAALAKAPGDEAWESYKRVINAQVKFEREIESLGGIEIAAETKTASIKLAA